jgi:predicted transcriptional regulator of viral defense system
MQPMKFLSNWLMENANENHYLFSTTDFRSLLPELSHESFKVLLSRAVRSGHLTRVCRSIYIYKKAMKNDGLVLFHIASILRSDKFNYISLETVLSDAGVISQVPINWISIISSGRSNKISCGIFGTIEFVHTDRSPNDVMDHLTYDTKCGMWRASINLALQDMKITRRNCDLIDPDIVNELI